MIEGKCFEEKPYSYVNIIGNDGETGNRWLIKDDKILKENVFRFSSVCTGELKTVQ